MESSENLDEQIQKARVRGLHGSVAHTSPPPVAYPMKIVISILCHFVTFVSSTKAQMSDLVLQLSGELFGFRFR